MTLLQKQGQLSVPSVVEETLFCHWSLFTGIEAVGECRCLAFRLQNHVFLKKLGDSKMDSALCCCL